MTGSTPKNAIIADTQFLTVNALHAILSSTGLFSGIWMAATNDELWQILVREKDCLLIYDIHCKAFGGLETLREIKTQYPELQVLILTNTIGRTDFSEINRLEINNIIYKNAGREELLLAVDNTLRGRKSYAGEILDQFLSTAVLEPIPASTAKITLSELEIVRMIVYGLTTKEIAQRRNISHHTVNAHRKNIFKKANVSTASELILHAIKSGWIENIEYYI